MDDAVKLAIHPIPRIKVLLRGAGVDIRWAGSEVKDRRDVGIFERDISPQSDTPSAVIPTHTIEHGAAYPRSPSTETTHGI